MSELRKVRVQHAERQSDGSIKKEDVDIYTDAEAVTMDGKGLKERVGELIDGRIEELIDGAPAELDTLKEISEELQKNQSSVTTILKKLGSCATTEDIPDKLSDLSADEKHRTVTDTEKDAWNNKVDKDGNKVLSTNDFTNALKAKVDALVAQTSDKKLIYKEKKNTNFNNLTAAGFYTVQTKANAPHTKYDYWSLIVLNSTAVDSNSYVQQIAINEKAEDKAIYVRKKTSSSWSSWIKLEASPDLSNYVTKVDGKGLSTNDYTKDDKRKVDSIPDNAKFTDTIYDLTPYAKKTEVPTKVSALTNDSGYKTETEILSLIQSSSKLKKEIVTTLPSTGKEDVIYLIKDTSGQTGNVYTEYLWIGGAFEVIGSTKMDLSGYAKKTDIENIVAESLNVSRQALQKSAKNEIYINEVNTKAGQALAEIENLKSQDIVIPTVWYMNQFYAGIGAKEFANTPPTVSDKVVGPAKVVENDARFRICKIIYCGDDYAYNNIDELKSLVARVLGEYKKVLFIASPSFSATEFSVINLKLCDYVQSALRIETVTGMYTDIYKKIKSDTLFNYYNHLDVVSTKNSAVGMREAIPKIMQIGGKKYKNQQLTDEEKTWLLNK